MKMRWVPFFSALVALHLPLCALKQENLLTSSSELKIPSIPNEELFCEEELFGPLPLFLGNDASPVERLGVFGITYHSKPPRSISIEERSLSEDFLSAEPIAAHMRSPVTNLSEPLDTADFFPIFFSEPIEGLPVEKSAAPSLFDEAAQPHIERKHPRRSPTPLHSYSLPEMTSINWSKDFNVELQLLPDKKENHYLFSLTLQPLQEVEVAPMRQNYYFLIDRSNSIAKHRFGVFKKAVVKALEHLEEGNTFNIFIFDRKIKSFHEKNLPITKSNIRDAEAFLEKESAGGLFAAGDLFTALNKAFPETIADDEAHTVLLLSDGETILKSKKQHQAIKNWMAKSGGKIDLYTAAVGTDNNLPLLDLMSTLNKGKLLHSATNSAFPRKFAKSAMDLQNPLVKELEVTVIRSDKESQVTLYPRQVRLPTLYQRPYTIIGTIDQLSPFTLLILGKHQGEEIMIEKKITFDDAKVGDRALEKKWAIEQAHLQYELFLKEGNATYLNEAKELLKSQHISLASE